MLLGAAYIRRNLTCPCATSDVGHKSTRRTKELVNIFGNIFDTIKLKFKGPPTLERVLESATFGSQYHLPKRRRKNAGISCKTDTGIV